MCGMGAPLRHSSVPDAIAPAARTWALRPWACWQAALLGLVAGAAWQVTQPALWRPGGYAGLLLAAVGCAGAAWACNRRAGAGRAWAVGGLCALAAACAMAAGCGARALAFQAQALSADLEGVDLRVTGVVAAMPQPAPWGLRWRLEVERAERAGGAQTGAEVALPPLIELAWYGPRAGERPAAGAAPPQPLEAGQRWLFTVRLKAPYGLRNPHGFDQELWL